MAMGFSTQRGTFKPYLPSPFRPSPLPPWRSVSTTTKAYSSSHPFCRPELQLPLSANSSCSQITVFKSSFQSKRGSCNSARASTVMEGRTLSVHGQGSQRLQMNKQKWREEAEKVKEKNWNDRHNFGSWVSSADTTLAENGSTLLLESQKTTKHVMDNEPGLRSGDGTIAASNQFVPKMDSSRLTGSSVEELERINKSNDSLSSGERMKKSTVKISKPIEENMDRRISSKEKTNGTIAASNQCFPKMDSLKQSGSTVEESEMVNESNNSSSLGGRIKKSTEKISKPIEENMDKKIPSKEKTNGTIAASNQCFPEMGSLRRTGSSVEEFKRVNKSSGSLSSGEQMKKSTVKFSKPIEENMDKRIPSKEKTNGTIAASNQCFPKMDSLKQTGSSVEEPERVNKSNNSSSLGGRMKKSTEKISKPIEKNMDKRIPSKEKTNGTIAASNQCFPEMDSLRRTGSSVEEFERVNKSNDSLSLGEQMKKSTEKISKLTEENMDKRIPSIEKTNAVSGELNETRIVPINTGYVGEHCERLSRLYDKVLVVDNITMAKKIVGLLTTEYKHLVWGCDTEVAKIEVRHETPVDHGELICFSIYCGPEVDFGGGKSYIWVDVLDGGGRDILMEFAPFFEDPLIKKVWHNYSFDSHIIENYGIKMSGFHADTMHMARLWDSSRKLAGGYSLEALTSDKRVMSGGKKNTLAGGSNKKKTFTEGETLIGKISMKTIFGKKKTKKDGSEGKLIKIAPVEEIQREERILWICYSALDSISTLKLFESLKEKLIDMKWYLDGEHKGTMYDFYEEYWRPFGELLVKMETEGMLVDKAYLAEVEKVATVEQKIAGNRFRNWASAQCPDALYMNVGSDAQLRQLFFGGIQNTKDQNESLPTKRIFKVPNVDKVIEDGKKVASKFRNITLCKIGGAMQTDMYTDSGWPKVSGDVLKTLAGKVSAEYDWTESTDDDYEFEPDNEKDKPPPSEKEIDTSSYGTAYAAFGGDKKGIEACHAIAALCEVCSIDSLLSNFIRPLQHSQISGKNGRIHCSLNINTETGRLSARRPNLQNQPALEKDRYKIRQAFIAAPGNSLVVADYGQLELRILAHLANCQSMLDAFKAGGDFHSRTAMNMYSHIRDAVENKKVLLEWHPQPGEEKPPVPLLKDVYTSERRKAKELNFSIAYGKTPTGLARDWKVTVKEAKETVNLWYKGRQEVREWQEARKKEAHEYGRVHTLLGRARLFPKMQYASNGQKGHIERAAINTPVQGSAADVAMCAMLEITRNARLKELGWRLLLQVHDEVILEGPTESAEEAKAIVVDCMSKPFYGTNFLKVGLSVDAKFEQNWYSAK